MSMLDGVSQCWVLSENCVIWWDAWAIPVAVFAALGSWIAAWATYLAVVRPLRRRRDEDSAVAIAAMDNFAAELIELRYEIGMVGFTISSVKPDSNPEWANAMVHQWARYRMTVPALEARPESLDLVKGLNTLRRAIGIWGSKAERFDLTPDPELPSEFQEYVINELNSDFVRLMDAIRLVARLVKPMVPEYAEELDKIIESGNGFLPFPPAPDVLS
ncbi:hypothetical protein D3C81_731700 [compost metagenome]